jgi:hypothetical protein
MKIKTLVLVALTAAALTACQKSPEQIQKEAEETQIRHDTLEKTAAEKQGGQEYRDALKRPGILQNTVMTPEDFKRIREEQKKLLKGSETPHTAP